MKTRTLNEKTLDSLLRIALEGPDVDKFPVADSAELWASKNFTYIL